MERETLLATIGRNPLRDSGSVNPPVHRTSTILFPDYETFASHAAGTYERPGYGRDGTPTTEALCMAIAALEGADYTWIFSSGLAAINAALMAYLKQGDHVLIADSVYGPTRRFCNEELSRFGIETTYYDPTLGAKISELMRPNTRVVFCESPGSLTFEMQDIPAIAKAAHAQGAIVIADNTWGGPMCVSPFELGVDVAMISATKYIGGHSDMVMGALSVRKENAGPLKRFYKNSGDCVSGDNAYLALRGLRTISVRMKQHQENALTVAQWLEKRPEIARVCYPALPGDAGHALWKRDMKGACGLFGVLLKPTSDEAVGKLMNALHHFGIGYSWGGYESLIIAYKPALLRTATQWERDAIMLRLHIGLEAPQDLIADLEQGFAAMKKAAAA
jgi:cystathionine beta-lyase